MWCRVNGCPWDSDTLLRPPPGGTLRCSSGAGMVVALSNATFRAELSWGARGCAQVPAPKHLAFAPGHLQPWRHIWPLPPDTCGVAALRGRLGVVQYAHENGCVLDARTISKAAQSGHLDVIKYARENGCEWSADTFSGASAGWHLDTLKYAREHGCPWDKNQCLAAFVSTKVFRFSSAEKIRHALVLAWTEDDGHPSPPPGDNSVG